MKIDRAFSTFLSRLATAFAGILVVALAILMPRIVRLYIGPEGSGYALILTLLYGILLFGSLAVAFLWILLSRVSAGSVFSDLSVLCLRVLSWSCVGAGILFIGLGFMSFYFSFAVGAAALFLGLILRVVKNCLEEATRIKEENDFTI